MIQSFTGRFRRDDRGATAIEFAILAGPLMLMVFGTIEYGRMMWVRQALYETAITGARCMGVKQTECSTGGAYSADRTRTFVLATATSRSLPLAASGVTLNASATCSGVTGFSQVTLAYTFQTVVPQIMGSLSGGVPLNVVACFPNQS